MKIFCIGENKTGTTSLGIALTILGFKDTNPPQSKDFIPYFVNGDYQKLFDFVRSSGMDSFQDRPWNCPGFHKILDKEFPGSKFIYLKRDPLSWLGSLKRFYKDDGKTDVLPIVFNRRWHGWLFPLLYGVTHITGNEAKLVEYLHKRDADVLGYFKNRPDNLLVLNLEKNHGWKELCVFLEKPIPDRPFPRANRTKK